MAQVPRPLLLFDGNCALCNGTVRWLLAHDRGRLHYAPLRSEVADAALQESGYHGDRSSVVLVDERGAHQHSTAVWRTLRLLPWPWRGGAAIRLIPRPLRDAAYRFVAANRFRIFGRSDICAMHFPSDQARRVIGL
jgi:predicted DCC family thiol-disulfide oxidoreductase YuxK